MDEIERAIATKVEHDPWLLETMKAEHAALKQERQKLAALGAPQRNSTAGDPAWPVLQSEARVSREAQIGNRRLLEESDP